MRVFITGGAGFIGSRLASLLAGQHQVTVYDNLHPQAHDGNPANLALVTRPDIRLVRADIRDASVLSAAIRDANPQIVYHLAAETGTGQSFDLPARYNAVNVMGTANLIESIRSAGPSVRRVILAGSRSVYGEGACLDAGGRPTAAVPRRDQDMARGDFAPKDRLGRSLIPTRTNADCVVAPTSVYASTKLMQEYLLQQGFWSTGVAVGILRLQNVFGPGQSLNNPYTGVLSIFCRQIQEGRTLDIYEDGQITRDFVLVDDVVRAFARMAEVDELPPEVLDIGAGEGATILQVARRLLAMFDRSPENLRVTGAFRPGDIRHAVADISRARNGLGWEPRHNLEGGLRQLVDWSRQAVHVS